VRNQAENPDPERGATVAVLSTWFERFGSDPVSLATVIKAAGDGKEVAGDEALREALMEVAGMRGVIDSRRLAHWCREQADRIVEGVSAIAGAWEAERRQLAG
jgi:hypothetical protein